MSISPLAFADSLRVGTVDFVSPDEIKVLLDIEAPDSMALNTGTPRSFPRVNSYVLVLADVGYLVGQVEWITIERSAFPKRKGLQDFGLIDLPFPLRKMSLNPIGTLISEGNDDKGSEIYSFRRGVDSFPSVGNSVLLPTQNQLHSIVESGSNRRVKIGTSLLVDNADIMIDPNRLFGRHLAVLGNTGSGKSCSVAGLIRWSLEAAQKECRNGEKPNARFIVLDPNGEYSRAFQDIDNARIFSVKPSDGVKQLQVPLWFWNTAEWSVFTQASPKTQRPTLVQALRTVRDGQIEVNVSPRREMRRYIGTILTTLKIESSKGSPWGVFPRPKNFFEKIKKWSPGFQVNESFSPEENTSLRGLITKISQFDAARRGQYPTYEFTKPEIDGFIDLLRVAHVTFGGSELDVLPIDANCPRPFTGNELLASVEANAEMMNVSEYIETMLMRIRTLLSDTSMKTIIENDSSVSLDSWLTDYIGDSHTSNGSVTVIDLSLVPTEIVHTLAAVIARMTLEALQRYRKLHSQHKSLPTVMVMEEAHTFVKRYKTDGENQDASSICCQVFEKIAREGRKYGLGLVLSSQRPSELSPTVLSQCNTFLLHRISNDRDQELVNKLVPDNLRGLLRDLPSLPSQNAILLGWASELPVLVRMNHLPQEHQPQSDDPDFWEVWTDKTYDRQGTPIKTDRKVNWKKIADDWQNPSSSIEDEEKQ